MKKIFTFISLCLLTLAASGRDVVFDPTVDTGNSFGTAGYFAVIKDGVTLEFSNGLANGIQYRLYKGQTLTVYTETGCITRIAFECTAEGEAQYGPGCLSASAGYYSYDGKIGIWTDECNNYIKFTAVKNQVRFTKIIVTVIDNGVMPPKITPASGTYYDPIEVTITCTDANSVIHYTTDGSEPSAESPVYTGPFSLHENTTVKAIAELDGEVSDVVSAEYHFELASVVQNIWESLLMEDGTTVRFANPVYVIAQHNRYLWVKDDSGYAVFFGDCGQSYNMGDEIPAGFVGSMRTYSCQREMTNLSGFKPAVRNIPIEPETIILNQVVPENFGHYVFVENVTIDPDTYIVTDDNGNVAFIYFNMGVPGSQIIPGESYDVWAIIGSYGNSSGDCIYQLLPIRIERHGTEPTLCDLYLLEDNTIVTVYHEIQVVYQSGNYLFFKDGETCYGQIYGNTGQTYHQGDIIPPGWSAKKTTYQGEPEFTTPLLGFMPASLNEPLEAEPATPDDVNPEHWAHYIVLYDVNVTFTSGNYILITDSQGRSCKGYLRFMSNIKEGHYNAIWGIVDVYRNEGELLVTDYNPKEEPVPVPVTCIEELFDLEQGAVARFVKPLVVVYQHGVRTYVRDIHGYHALMYGMSNVDCENGDSIVGCAKWTVYQGVKQISPEDEWQKVGHGPKEKAHYITIEDASADMAHDFIGVKDVIFTTDENGRNVIDDGTGQLLVYYPYPVDTIHHWPAILYDLNCDDEVNIADINCLIDLIISGKTYYVDGVGVYNGLYDVEGFLTWYREELWLYPIRIGGCLTYITRLLGDINLDGEVNIADLNILVDIMLRQ
jgi:hypothetical protein